VSSLWFAVIILYFSSVFIHCKNRDSSDGIATGTAWSIGVLRFDSRRGLGIFLFTTESTQALGLTQPPIPRVSWALSLGVKRPGQEADHSPPFSTKVKE
jgi:hypothetical protein